MNFLFKNKNSHSVLFKEEFFITAKKPNITDKNNYEPWISFFSLFNTQPGFFSGIYYFQHFQGPLLQLFKEEFGAFALFSFRV